MSLRALRGLPGLWLTAPLLLLGLFCGPTAATQLPVGFVETLVADGMGSATASAHSPDGRIFVGQQDGSIRVIKDGALLPTPFATLEADASGERGLLGIGLDPGFPAAPFVYVYYSSLAIGANRLSRLMADGDVALPGEQVLLDLPPYLGADIHFGGGVHFGPDGKLYLGAGEHGRLVEAQSLESMFGKMLRLESDGTIPADNPFFAVTSGSHRAIWALGLRNPFTYAFDRGTGRLFINDVGSTLWEEINEGAPGANYGWPESEGPTNDPRFVAPLYVYRDVGCAVTGGTFYSPPVPTFPAAYIGGYFFSDFCNLNAYWLDPTTYVPIIFASGLAGNPVDLDVGPDGSLYYLARVGQPPRTDDTAAIYRISYTGSQAPQITLQPVSQTVFVGEPATFIVAANGADGFQWQRDGTDIPGATATTYALPSTSLLDDGASFRAVVNNGFGSTTSTAGVLTVTDNHAPSATISIDAARPLYWAGDTIGFSGAATDPEDGPLGPQAFTWQVNFHHDSHWHPFLPATPGMTAGSFTIPTGGEVDPDVLYRVVLSVEDSGGRSFATSVDVHPELATFRLDTVPPGLRVDLDGQPGTAPRTITSVVNFTRTISTPGIQNVGGIAHTFHHWSDGGVVQHAITVPRGATTYVAYFESPGVTTTTTTTLPPSQCDPVCDDGDACTADGCLGASCVYSPVLGVESASCVCARPMPAACGTEPMPNRLQLRVDRACLKLTRAHTSPPGRVAALLRSAARAWRRAALLLERRAGSDGQPSAGCTAALLERYRDAEARALTERELRIGG